MHVNITEYIKLIPTKCKYEKINVDILSHNIQTFSLIFIYIHSIPLHIKLNITTISIYIKHLFITFNFFPFII